MKAYVSEVKWHKCQRAGRQLTSKEIHWWDGAVLQWTLPSGLNWAFPWRLRALTANSLCSVRFWQWPLADESHHNWNMHYSYSMPFPGGSLHSIIVNREVIKMQPYCHNLEQLWKFNCLKNNFFLFFPFFSQQVLNQTAFLNTSLHSHPTLRVHFLKNFSCENHHLTLVTFDRHWYLFGLICDFKT